LGDCDWFEAAEVFAEVDGVLFCGNEAVGLLLIAEFLQGLNISRAIAVMIAKDHFAGWFNTSISKLGEKQGGPCDSAKDNGAGWWVFHHGTPADSPNWFVEMKKECLAKVIWSCDRMGAVQR